MTGENFKKIYGVISALPTPFLEGKVDFKSLENLVAEQIKNGIQGLVVNGTTAESPTLEEDEVKEIFKKVQTWTKGNIPLILGVGSNSTEKTIQSAQKAKQLGADATLVVVPYYNKPPQRGLIEHFSKVAQAADIPNIVYNVPGRTITGMTSETIQALTQKKNICGIKEASGNIDFDRDVKKHLDKSFTFLSGDDGTFIDFMKIGGHGIISVMSNVIPKKNVEWFNQCKSGQVLEAEKDFSKYKNFIAQIYIEPNPIPIKWMLYRMGIFKSAELRLPLIKLSEEHYTQTEKLMKDVGLIS